MPDARCTRGPVCKLDRENAHEHTGSAESIRHSLRNGFTAYTRSPRRRIRLVTVVGELTAYPRPVGPTRLRQLDTSNGCRNHTPPPYATTPFVCRPFDRSRFWLNPKPALPFTCAPGSAASTASRPASLTIRIRPSVGQDGEGYIPESGQRKEEYFLTGAGHANWAVPTDLPDGLIRPVNATPPARKILLRFPQQMFACRITSKPMPPTDKTEQPYFRDYPVTGHTADTPKMTRMTLNGPNFFIVSGLNFGGYAIGSGLPLSTT